MEQKLWAMLIPGPDDVWAMPSKEAAEEYAAKHNKAIESGLLAERFCLPKESVQARVIEWPYSAEAHAEAMESGEPDVFDGCLNKTPNAGYQTK
jgi:hypothetical protein